MKKSVGKSQAFSGLLTKVDETKFILDRTRRHIIIDVIPCSAVRMTQRDRWFTDPNHKNEDRRQRPAVTKYFAFKNKIVSECAKTGYKLSGCIEAVFCIPMPDSWSEKKKERMNGLPHKSTPDVDNLTKAIMDSWKENDSFVWKMKAEKRWSYRGAIILFE